ncbi:hypothetical protein [Cellulosilyticum sp. I15G10I2]|uniref:hypothetical protein n=1 Tax=Cellulosilyticum sp. I15G10I2 TaxID=1892843 RepID=UPI0014954E98|nr:hypothetical protein [Cellulosilyticum sp. I15G10I2]
MYTKHSILEELFGNAVHYDKESQICATYVMETVEKNDCNGRYSMQRFRRSHYCN